MSEENRPDTIPPDEIEAGELPIGRERTIYYLQRRIKLLEASLRMARELLVQHDRMKEHADQIRSLLDD